MWSIGYTPLAKEKDIWDMIGEHCHLHYKGCVKENNTYLYQYDNEVIWLVADFFKHFK